MALIALTPATGETVAAYPETPRSEVTEAIRTAHQVRLEWKRTPFDHRSDFMSHASTILRDRAREFGELMTLEMGKPISGAVAEAEKCAWVSDYYAENAQEILADQEVEAGATRSFVTFQPLGVILAVMPRNFPFWQVFRFAAPNLMAGKAGLLKHASNVPGCALAIEEVFREAGFPEGLSRTLLIPGSRVDSVIEDTVVGPQARDDLPDELHDQVERSIERGARCISGGAVPEGPGAYYPPTILTDVGPGMPAYSEELFGPVASVIPAKDEADALRIATDSCFGLGTAVFTRDEARGIRIAREELEAGAGFVNAFVRSDPRLPFGEVKESGYGRELSPFGILEFVNIKTVWVA